jgi:hypothetical protein
LDISQLLDTLQTVRTLFCFLTDRYVSHTVQIGTRRFQLLSCEALSNLLLAIRVGNFPALGSESLDGANLGLSGFLFAIFGRSGCFHGIEKASGNSGYFVHGRQKCRFIRLGRLVKARDLPNELDRGGSDFFVGDRRVEVEQSFDISAHLR